MFGIYRYLLAHMVALAHLWPDLTNWTGWYAVFGFYVLSGYLMTLVLNRTYGFSRVGTGSFLVNRALRIFPPYLCVLALALLVAGWIPQVTRGLNLAFQLPTTSSGWLSNVVIFGLNSEPLRLVPPAWSLDVECVYYLALGLLLARHRFLTLAWLVASIGFTVYLNQVEAPFVYRYRAVWSASLPFSLGATLFYLRSNLRLGARHVPASLLVYFGHAALALVIWGDRDGVAQAGFYYSLAAASYVTLALSWVETRHVPSWLARLDAFLGDLSYPVFLCHWVTAAITVQVLFGGHSPEGGALFLASLLPINLIAWGIHRAVETPLSGWRRRVRTRSQRTPTDRPT